MKKIRIGLSLLVIFCQFQVFSQATEEKPSVVFDELYDEPYAINKLFIGFQPLYGEVFATNVNAGYGAEVHYLHKTYFDVKAHFRKSYSSSFFDFNRDLARKTSSVENTPEIYNYFEFGGTYHIKDFDVSSTTKIFLHKKKMSSQRWAATVPLYAQVPSKLRKIYGARAGAVVWNSTVDLNRVLEDQGLTNGDIVNGEGTGLPDATLDVNGNLQDFNVFSNIYSTNVYVGGSLSLIRNIAVSFDTYDEGLDDGLLTLYFDLLFAPSLNLDPVIYGGEEYSTDVIKLNKIGFRAGLEGKYNRTLSWGYGGEIGYRPSVDGSGFYAMFKLSFPLFSSNLDNKVEAFEK